MAICFVILQAAEGDSAAELQAQVATLEGELSESREATTQLAESLAATTEKLTAAEASGESAKALQEQLAESEGKMAAAVQAHSDEVVVMTAEKARVQTEADSVAAALAETKALLDQSQELQEQGVQAAAALKETHATAEAAWDKSRGVLESCNAQTIATMEQVRGDVNYAREEAIQAKAQLGESASKITSLEASLADAAAKYSVAEQSLDDANNKMVLMATAADESSKSVIADLQAQLSNAKDQLATATAATASADTAHVTELETIVQKHAAAAAKVAALEAAQVEFDNEVQETYEEFEKTVGNLTQKLEAAKGTHGSLSEETAALRVELEAGKLEHGRLQADLLTASAQASDTGALDALSDQAAAAEAQGDMLREQLAAAEQKLEDASAAMQAEYVVCFVSHVLYV